MKQRFLSLSLLATLAVLTCPILPGKAFAQLPTWNGSFTDVQNHNVYPFTMVGGDPSNTGITRIPVYVIPLKVVFQSSTCPSGQITFDPNAVLANGESAVANLISSPIFTPVAFTQGSGDTLQYIDAFQRANFWSIVQNNPGYHLKLLSPTILQEQTLSVSLAKGAAADNLFTPPYGVCVGLVEANWFVGQLEAIIASLDSQELISPNGVAMIVLYDVFFGLYTNNIWVPNGSGGHLETPVDIGGELQLQTWLWAAYNDGTCSPGLCYFQDVDDFSHEVGEWADDPSGHTPAPCESNKGYLEVGDPLLGNSSHNTYFAYTETNGFVYHLQDLVFLPYFGAVNSTSYNSQLTFQGNPESLSYCGSAE
jgi:hypothetical protein